MIFGPIVFRHGSSFKAFWVVSKCRITDMRQGFLEMDPGEGNKLGNWDLPNELELEYKNGEYNSSPKRLSSEKGKLHLTSGAKWDTLVHWKRQQQDFDSLWTNNHRRLWNFFTFTQFNRNFWKPSREYYVLMSIIKFCLPSPRPLPETYAYTLYTNKIKWINK